jgi:tRNA A-37 threonylcarbamoyl transferase component Bud32
MWSLMMTQIDFTSELPAAVPDTNPNSLTQTRLRGQWLVAGRLLWLAITAISIGVFIIAIPARFNLLRQPIEDTLSTSVSLTLLASPLSVQESDLLNHTGFSLEFYAAYSVILETLSMLLCLGVGLLIFARRSDDWGAIVTSLFLILLGATLGNPQPAISVLGSVNKSWINVVFSMQAIVHIIALLFLHVFPNGRFAVKWSRWAFGLWAIWMVLLIAFPNSIVNLFTWPLPVFLLVELLVAGPAVYVQVYRFRRIASVTQRQQTKWAVYGFVAAFSGGVLLPILFQVIFPSVAQRGSAHVLYSILNEAVFVGALLLIPITVTFSVLRYRLWEIDLIINRSLVYGALTVLLGSVFAISLLVIQEVSMAITGGMQSPLAIVGSSLVIGALFQPTRKRVQRFVDRRFFHIMTDVQRHSTTTAASVGMLTGTRLNNFEILEPLGRGGMAEVYKGRQSSLNRSVAIKILTTRLNPDNAVEQDFRIRFEREARTVAGLRHTNIVQVIDFGEANGLYFMVMELITGLDLEQFLHQRGMLNLAEALPILRDVANALDYAHQQGLVHRDVKTSNIMLQPQTANGTHDSDYRAVLMDFGIAKIMTGNTGLTRTGVIGTLDYIAPEQIFRRRKLTRVLIFIRWVWLPTVYSLESCHSSRIIRAMSSMDT